VYARFRDGDGSENVGFIRDDITLDTRASIASVTENSGGRTLEAGDTLHLTLDGGEIGGTASVDLAGLNTVNLFDDTPASPTPDGIYEADFVIPGGVSVINGTITGNFTDAAGNKAQARTALTFVSIANVPQPVQLSSFPVSETEMELDWTKSSAGDFASYLLFRSTGSSVDSSSTLVNTQTSSSTTSFRDTDVKTGITYRYALYTVVKSGLMAKSNVIVAQTVSNPPAPVTLTAFVVSESEVELDWSKSTATDFASYQLFRSDSANVTNASSLLQTQTAATTTSFRDTDRKPSTDAYYAIYTVDRAGLTSKSNVVKATTFANQAPKPVQLFVTHQDSTDVTLSWTANDDKDFASYRVFRSVSSGVGTNAANLAGTVTSQTTTQFVDSNIVKGLKFFYIVVVFDKWGTPSAVSNEVSGPN
jgi:hypothetical protein